MKTVVLTIFRHKLPTRLAHAAGLFEKTKIVGKILPSVIKWDGLENPEAIAKQTNAEQPNSEYEVCAVIFPEKPDSTWNPDGIKSVSDVEGFCFVSEVVEQFQKAIAKVREEQKEGV